MSSKTTTYVVRTNAPEGFDARATDSMPYTHALVTSEGYARSWHTSAALAAKANKDGFRVVQAEAFEGTKATVVKRLKAALAAEAVVVPMTDDEAIAALREKGRQAAKATKAPKAAKDPIVAVTKGGEQTPAQQKAATKADVKAAAPKAAKAKAAPAAPKAPRTTAVTEGDQKCRVCAEVKPVTAFPTKGANKEGVIGREDRCRKCRDAARKAPAAKGKKSA